MWTAMLIMVREGFEAALIVALVLAYLRRIERLDLATTVWWGVVGAAALSVGIGVAVHLTIGTLEGVERLRTFAAVSLLAVCVLTWMLFWMRRQARAIKGDLEIRVDRALASERVRVGIVAVAFLAVLREGIEAALFMIAAATESSGRSVLIGAVLGLAIAAVLGGLVYAGGRRLPMRAFFQVTGLVLIVFAAGLLARAVLFLQSANDLGSLNLNGVYDVRSVAWLTQSSEVGKFLAALFGWDPRPSIEQIVAWFAYVVPTTWLFLRPARPEPAREPEPELVEPAVAETVGR